MFHMVVFLNGNALKITFKRGNGVYVPSTCETCSFALMNAISLFDKKKWNTENWRLY